MNEKRPHEGGIPRRTGQAVYEQYKPKLYRRCNRRHWIAFSPLQAKRGGLFPYRTYDRDTGDRHECGVSYGR